MIPSILELGPIPIRSFGLLVALALFAGAVRLSMSFARYGIDPRLAERYVTAAGISGLLGARVWHILENWSYLKHDLMGALFASQARRSAFGSVLRCAWASSGSWVRSGATWMPALR
jgi:prolipoprotein diacylglyceryltransferase